jgi:hypothetical protein
MQHRFFVFPALAALPYALALWSTIRRPDIFGQFSILGRTLGVYILILLNKAENNPNASPTAMFQKMKPVTNVSSRVVGSPRSSSACNAYFINSGRI